MPDVLGHRVRADARHAGASEHSSPGANRAEQVIRVTLRLQESLDAGSDQDEWQESEEAPRHREAAAAGAQARRFRGGLRSSWEREKHEPSSVDPNNL